MVFPIFFPGFFSLVAFWTFAAASDNLVVSTLAEQNLALPTKKAARHRTFFSPPRGACLQFLNEETLVLAQGLH